MTMQLSQAGLRFIEKWEELVLYVYDDKVPKRRINGKRQYPEWDGGEVIGTLTIGYGHTDAAGWPKIARNMQITSTQADELLDADLKPCKEAVLRRVKVKLAQGQFDCLVSFVFNAGEGSLAQLLKSTGLNKGNYDQVPKHLMQYVLSKGERMQGLVNRRAGEVALWGREEDEPRDLDEPASDQPEVFSPKAERAPPPGSIVESKTAGAAVATAAAGTIATIQTANENAGVIKAARDNAADLGLFDALGRAVHTPWFPALIIILAATGFIVWDRWRKLQNDHV